jgi:uncharacterized protein (TIGR03435 family)
MQEPDDKTLLAEYVGRGSESAFATLVTRHVDKVYSVALRQTRNPHSAEEIAQAVFVIFANKARQLLDHPALSGWLYETTRLTSITYVRSEIRRAHREQEAQMQSTLSDESDANLWTQISPLLEPAMARLSEIDRHAIVLRFFDGKSMSEVGTALGMHEDTAKKRVNRAVEKMQRYFRTAGVTSSADAITGAICAYGVSPAPVILAKTAAAMALANNASTSTLTLINGALKLMAWTKAKTIIAVGVTALLITSTAVVGIKTAQHRHAGQVESYFTQMDSAFLETAPPMILLRPTKYPKQGDYIITGAGEGPDTKLMRRGADFTEILSTAYSVGPDEMILPANVPRGRFDLLLTTTNHQQEALRAEIKRQFGLDAHMETRKSDVLFLRVVRPDAPGFRISTNEGAYIWTGPNSITLRGFKMSDPGSFDIPRVLARYYQRPVVDQTDLTNTYDVDLHWNANLHGNALKTEIDTALREQLGFEAVPGRHDLDLLVIQKAN